jgi:hypothetical protein
LGPVERKPVSHKPVSDIRSTDGADRYRALVSVAILDNYAAHKHPNVRRWLNRHERFTFHFTPTSCSFVASTPSKVSSQNSPSGD